MGENEYPYTSKYFFRSIQKSNLAHKNEVDWRYNLSVASTFPSIYTYTSKLLDLYAHGTREIWRSSIRIHILLKNAPGERFVIGKSAYFEHGLEP